MEIGQLGGSRPPGIDADDLRVGMGGLASANALHERGVALEGVGADEEEAVGEVDVLIAARRLVLAEDADVAGGGRGHAKPWVAVDVVRADARLEELVGRVALLGEELAGAVEGDRISA